jgi:hypothetical protein
VAKSAALKLVGLRFNSYPVTILPRDGKFEKWTNLRLVGSIPVKVILYNQSQNSPMEMYIPFNVKN